MSPSKIGEFEESYIRSEIRDGVGIITLDRPRKLNAMTVAMYADFNAATHAFEKDSDVGAVMVVSSGSAFCAGGDLDMVSGAKSGAVQSDEIDLHLLDPATLSKPIFSGIVGPCVGEGFAIALASDMVIAGTSARFLLPEVAIGVLPVDIPLWAGARMNPIHILDALLTGDWKDASWAERCGLVNSVVPDEDVRQTVFDLARRVALAPRAVVAQVKSLVYAAHYTGDRAGLRQYGAKTRMRIIAEDYADQSGS